MFQTSNNFQASSCKSLLTLLRGKRFVVLSGAGCSTDSGIPDYRGPDGRLRVRTPIQYRDFVKSSEVRKRYWARSTIGWPVMSEAEPNPAHTALEKLEKAGLASGIITQNVDGLHQVAGSRQVVELHGSLANVRCLECRSVFSRSGVQRTLVDLNREWLDKAETTAKKSDPRTAPDGDAEISTDTVRNFIVPECKACGGLLKPDVVFFGESVPAEYLSKAWSIFDKSEVLLVVGSSLTVYSGRRFVYRASQEKMPVGILTLGQTRGDELASVKIEDGVGVVLPRLASSLINRDS